MDLIAEYRNTITQRYAQKILDKSGVQNRSFQNAQQNVSENSKNVIKKNIVIVSSNSRVTRNNESVLNHPQKRYKSCKKIKKESSLIEDSNNKDKNLKKMHKHRGSLDSPIKISINDIDNHWYNVNKRKAPK